MGFIKNLLSFLNGFRKFTIMLLLMVVGISFRISEHISGAEMVDLLKFTVIAFFSANGLEHMTSAVKEWLKNKV